MTHVRVNGAALTIGFAVYAIALVVTAPAGWMASILDRFPGSSLVLREPRGTLWDGSGHLYVRGRSRDLLYLGPVRWRVSAAGLVRGTLAADVALGPSDPAARVELGIGAATVRALRLELPGAVFAILLPQAAVLRPAGRLVISAEELFVSAGAMRGNVQIEWHGGSFGAARGLAFGSHVARLRGDGEGVLVELASLEGPVRIQGTGKWTRREGLSIEGIAEPRQDPEGTLTAFFGRVCADARGGRCAFRISGLGATGSSDAAPRR